MSYEIHSSQFERVDGKTIDYIPSNDAVFEELENFTEEELLELGLQCWKGSHYLFPHEWYDAIPDGFEVVDINGKIEEFEHGVSGDDKRFGVLPYGIIRGNNSVDDIYEDGALSIDT